MPHTTYGASENKSARQKKWYKSATRVKNTKKSKKNIFATTISTSHLFYHIRGHFLRSVPCTLERSPPDAAIKPVYDKVKSNKRSSRVMPKQSQN